MTTSLIMSPVKMRRPHAGSDGGHRIRLRMVSATHSGAGRVAGRPAGQPALSPRVTPPPANLASQRVAEKAGFRYTGTFTDPDGTLMRIYQL
jgi:hypothetical protein